VVIRTVAVDVGVEAVVVDGVLVVDNDFCERCLRATAIVGPLAGIFYPTICGCVVFLVAVRARGLWRLSLGIAAALNIG